MMGGRKMCRENRQYNIVCETNEHRTSQVCSACFEPIELARATRVQAGQVKHIRLHGAVVCKSRECPRVLAGKATQGHDSNSAVNIAIAGASNLLSGTKSTLPPFRHFALTPKNNTRTTSGSLLTPRDSCLSTAGTSFQFR